MTAPPPTLAGRRRTHGFVLGVLLLVLVPLLAAALISAVARIGDRLRAATVIAQVMR